MSEHITLWDHLLHGPESVHYLNVAMEHVAHGLSDMVGQRIVHDEPQIKWMSPAQVLVRAGSIARVIGIYLEMQGELSGRAILMLPWSFALNLTDIVVGVPRGTTTELGPIEQSALTEIGNVALSYFLNAVASSVPDTTMLRLSPPNIVVDKLGNILNLAIGPQTERDTTLLLVETTFQNAARTTQIRFWLLPDQPSTQSNHEKKR